MGKKTILLFLLITIITVISFNVSYSKNNNFERQKVYTNSLGVTMPVHKYDQLLSMGFADIEIEYLTQKEVNKFLKMKPVKITNSEKFIKSSYKKDIGGNIIVEEEELSESKVYLEIEKEKSKKEKISFLDRITVSRYHNLFQSEGYMPLSSECNYDSNEQTCFAETTYKKLTITFVALDENTAFIKTTVDWLKVPYARYSDVIGFTIPVNSMLVEDSWGGKMTTYTVQDDAMEIVDVDVKGYDAVEDDHLFVPDLYTGVALFQDLVNKDSCVVSPCYYTERQHKIINTIWGTATYSGDDNSFLTNDEIAVKGAYRHAIKSIDLNSFSLSITWGVPSLSAGGSVEDDYDTELYDFAYLDRDDLDFSSSIQFENYGDDLESITSFYNKNDVFISRNAMENLVKLGFDFIEIDELSSTEVSIYGGYDIIKSEASINESSSYKQMKITISQIGDDEIFIKVNMLWTKGTTNDDYDLLAIGHNSLVTATKYKGKQIVQETTVVGDSTSSEVYNYPETLNNYFSEDKYGLVMKHNLVNANGMKFITLEMEAIYSGSASSFYGIFMHQTSLFAYNISNTEFNKEHSISEISFNPSSLEDKYDTQYTVSKYFNMN